MNAITRLLYNLLFFPLLLILLPGYLLRMMRRGGYQNKAAQRFGSFDRTTIKRIGKGRIWIHAASVGEVGIALKFITEFQNLNPDTRFLLSVTTSTGLAIAEKQANEKLEVIANPVDFPFLTIWLVKRFHPSVLLFVEADLWPNRIVAARKLGIPVILINARLSPRSEKRFRMAKLITAPFFNTLSRITLTEAEDRGRWLSLGVRSELLHLAGNIKYDNALPAQQDALKLPEHLGWGNSDPLFLAASTHAGEEEEVAKAFQITRREFPNLRLVIAPRHVERRMEIVESLKSLGLSISLRSKGMEQPSDLLLLDTTGELSAWYPLASVAFVGKSLPCSVNHGGQNMIEPLQAGTPVLIGPYTSNFEPLATGLCDTGAVQRVSDAASIARSIENLLREPSRREAMLNAAKSILTPHQGATKRTCKLVTGIMENSIP